MSNLTLWSPPAWNTDRWLREFFGPAAADDWFKPLTGFNSAAELVKDGDDAVVLGWSCPVSTSRTTSGSSWSTADWSSTASAATNTPMKVRALCAGSALRVVSTLIPVARAHHRRGRLGVL